MIYLGTHFLKERKFHSDFKKAVIKSDTFKSFVDNFYIGKYVEQLAPKEYFYENDTNQIRIFVENKNLTTEITLYKYSNKPDKFIILSTNEEISQFIESQTDWSAISKKDKIRWTIKYQVEIPCIFGNKKLKSRIEL